MLSSGADILLDWVTIKRLLEGLCFTVKISFISIILSVIFGTLFGIVRLSNAWIVRFVFRVYLELVRVLPTLVLLYLLYFVLPSAFDLNVDGQIVGVLAFVFWGAAEMSDIVRAAIISLPKHQTESALAIGLNRRQIYQYVLLPQAFKRVLAPTLNLSSRIIMTSSLLVLIGVRDVVKVGKEIIELNAFTNSLAPFWIYGIILLMFFLICYPLSKVSKALINR